MVVVPLSLRAFYPSNPQGASNFLANRRRVKNHTGPAKSQRRLFLQTACCKSFSLDLGQSDRGVVYSGIVRPGRISPVRFFRMKESLEVFSALPGGSRIGEFLKRKQADMV
jgi:hypothetical protein